MLHSGRAFQKYKYDSFRGIVTMYSGSAKNVEGTIYANAVHNIHGVTLLKEGYWMVMAN